MASGGGNADAALARALQDEENVNASGANDEALAQQLAAASLSDGPSFAVHGAAMRGPSNPAPVAPAFHSIPRWNEIDPKVAPQTEAEATILSDAASYIASKGNEQLAMLKEWMEHGRGLAWTRDIKVHGAAVNGHTNVVKYLLDEVEGIDVCAVDEKTGYAPLHMAAVWGRPGIIVLLLSRGARLGQLNRDGATALEMAMQRVTRLDNVHDGYQDISMMRREGRELVDILQGCTDTGGYQVWAGGQINSFHVQRHSPKLISTSQRYCMVVLRELMDQRRATIPTEAEAAAKKAAEEAEAKAAAEAEAVANAAPVKSLVECLTEAKLNDKMILRQFDKWLKVKTMAELGKVTREDVAELDELDAKDRRDLWKWIQTNQPEKEPEKPKKKKLSKRKAAEARAAEEKAAAALTYRKALQIAFRPELPNDAFNVIVTLLFSPKEIFSLTEDLKNVPKKPKAKSSYYDM